MRTSIFSATPEVMARKPRRRAMFPAAVALSALALAFPVAPGADAQENVIYTPDVPLEIPVEVETEVSPATSLKQAPLWKEIAELLENPYMQECVGSDSTAGVDCVATIERRPRFLFEDPTAEMPPLNVYPLGFNQPTGQPLRLRTNDGEINWDQPGPLFAPGEFADPTARPIIGELVVVDENDFPLPANPGGFTAEDCPALAVHETLGLYGGGCLAVINTAEDDGDLNVLYGDVLPPDYTIVAVPAFFPDVEGGAPMLHEYDPVFREFETLVELEEPVNENHFLRAETDTRGLNRRMQDYPRGREAAEILGKALFWDMQVGSDSVQACGSCHFHAGADNRTRNQLSPGFLGGDLTLDVAGPNEEVVEAHFPFHKLTDPQIPGEPLLNPGNVASDANDVLSSMGVIFRTFQDVLVGEEVAFGPEHMGVRPLLPDVGIADPDPIPDFDGVRRVEPRNTPTMHSAAFNFDNFWDGRARFHFNGGSVFGQADPYPHIYIDANNTLEPMTHPAEADEPIEEWVGGDSPVRIKFSSLASQAVGPPLSEFEMSFFGRNWAKIGKKLLQDGVTPLANQLVATDDSELGHFSNQGGDMCPSNGPNGTAVGKPGLCISYNDLIRLAFPVELYQRTNRHLVGAPAPCTAAAENGVLTPAGCDPFDGYRLEVANGPVDPSDTNQFTQMEANFSLFFGLAVQTWEQILIPDDTPLDRFFDMYPRAGFGVGQPGEQGTLPPDQLRELVLGPGAEPSDGLDLSQIEGFGPMELFGFDIFAGANLTAALPVGHELNPEGYGSNPFLRSGRCMICHLGPEQADHTITVAHGLMLPDTEFELPPPGVAEPTGPNRYVSGISLAEELEEGAQDAIEVENRNMAIAPESFGDPPSVMQCAALGEQSCYHPEFFGAEYATALALPNTQAFQDNGIYNLGLRPTDEDIGRGGPDPFGWPLSLAALAMKNLEGVDYEACNDPGDAAAHPTGCLLTSFDPLAEGFGLFEETGEGTFFPGTAYTLQSVNPGLGMEPANPLLPDYIADWVNNLPAGELHPQVDELAFAPNHITHPPFAEFGEIQFGSDQNCLFVGDPLDPVAIANNDWGDRCPNVQSAVPSNFGGSLNGTWPFPNRIATKGAIKAPQLRNVELTGPYFRTGSYLTLRQVIDFYMRGGDFPITNLENRDPNILDIETQVFAFGDTQQLQLLIDAGLMVDGIPDTFARYLAMPDTTQENTPEPATSTPDAAKEALVKFLLALTDERVAHERAPFDRPEIFVPIDGTAPDNTGGRVALLADDRFRHLEAVGADGHVDRLEPFLGIGSTPDAAGCDHFDSAC